MSTGTPSGNDLDTATRELHTSKVAILHKATLQDLLHCGNDAVHHLLWECNDLLREW